ncbi:MAG: hypothetical protein ACYC7E_15615 [Armatimonadota bacterium]
MGLNVLRDLQAKSPLLPAPYHAAPRYALFSASGFTDELREQAMREDVVLVDAEMLLQ